MIKELWLHKFHLGPDSKEFPWQPIEELLVNMNKPEVDQQCGADWNVASTWLFNTNPQLLWTWTRSHYASGVFWRASHNYWQIPFWMFIPDLVNVSNINWITVISVSGSNVIRGPSQTEEGYAHVTPTVGNHCEKRILLCDKVWTHVAQWDTIHLTVHRDKISNTIPQILHAPDGTFASEHLDWNQ